MMTDIYNILILPIEYVMETVFFIIYHFTDNTYAAIAGLSLFVGLITLPLFNNADRISSRIKEKKNELNEMSEHIKKCFRGDERTMILSAHYRLNGYSPLSDIVTLLPLLLQIPFFIAAYRFLSGTELLAEGFLGRPDGLIQLGGISINLLPVLMTLINIISSVIYTKGGSRSEKLSALIPAFVFLFILYNCPGGLVIYWTLNNVFSLFKNLLIKRCRDARKAAVIILKVAVALYFIWYVLTGKILVNLFTERYDIFLLGILPLTALFVSTKKSGTERADDASAAEYFKKGLIMILPLTLLAGAYIPLRVLDASPMEFVNVFDYLSPFVYIKDNIFSMAGMCLLWLSVILIALRKDAEKTGALVCGAVISFFAAFFIFGGNRRIDAMMLFDENRKYELKYMLINLAVIMLIGLAAGLTYRFYKKFVFRIAMVMSAALLGASLYLAVGINSEIRTGLEHSFGTTTDGKGFLPLSKNGKNVAVIMLDRAIGRYVPYIFEERPELKEKFDGFTWYPNTLSYGGYTLLGAPALYGGYEYTPDRINQRADETLEDKVNESMLVACKLFADAGFDASIVDPPYTGLKETHDLSIYNDYPEISAYQLFLMFSGNNTSEKKADKEKNLFLYVWYELLPRISGELLYNDGRVISAEENSNYYLAYKDSMEELKRLPDFFRAEEEGNCFFMLHNLLPHSPASLLRDDYVTLVDEAKSQYDSKGITIDGVTMKLDSEEQVRHFQVNVASFIWLGKWFDWLKENGLYDNTRIILVADHGWCLGQYDDMLLDDGTDREEFNPLLMVKDFGAHGFSLSDEFMTNADTLKLSYEGLIEDPLNPFTGKALDGREKADRQLITTSDHLSVENHGEYTYNLDDGYWYAVDGDLFDAEKWERRDNGR